MAFDDFLNHRCSIYHVKKAASDLGFGITDDNDFSYQANPDKINEDVRWVQNSIHRKRKEC